MTADISTFLRTSRVYFVDESGHPKGWGLILTHERGFLVLRDSYCIQTSIPKTTDVIPSFLLYVNTPRIFVVDAPLTPWPSTALKMKDASALGLLDACAT